jgi:hypothetical protein
MATRMYLSVEVVHSLLWQLSYVEYVVRTRRFDGSFITCPTPSRIVSPVSSLGYSGVCTEVAIATGPASGAETSQWSAMIRDTVRYGGNDKNSSDMECHQVDIRHRRHSGLALIVDYAG